MGYRLGTLLRSLWQGLAYKFSFFWLLLGMRNVSLCTLLSRVQFLLQTSLQEYNEIFDSVPINIAEIKVLGHYFHAIQML